MWGLFGGRVDCDDGGDDDEGLVLVLVMVTVTVGVCVSACVFASVELD